MLHGATRGCSKGERAPGQGDHNETRMGPGWGREAKSSLFELKSVSLPVTPRGFLT